jgi:penicillin-binding protein 1A
MGNNETGGVAAIPIWIAYMAKALKGVPPSNPPVPEGLVTAKINAESGLRDDGGVTDYFYAEFPPRRGEESVARPAVPTRDIRDQLF